MRNGSKLKIIIITLGIVFSISSMANYIKYDCIIEDRDENDLKKSEFFTEFFIHIDNNDPAKNWSYTASSYAWCSGDGSWGNPYTIENVTIDESGSPTGNGILISNSRNEYFIIQNCTIYEAEAWMGGIMLFNTANGSLINNNCSNNKGMGIYLWEYADNNTISGNTVNNNYGGIYLEDTCIENNISGNNVNNNNQYGILFQAECHNNTISGNIVNNNYVGISLHRSNDNTVSGNTANNNDQYGIYLWRYSDDNILMNNIANDNTGYGIHLREYCDNNTISGNNVSFNENSGIYLETFCNNNTIMQNLANDNTGYGIHLREYCDNNSILGNTASDNSGHGINLREYCDNNNIINNTIIRNNLGIMLHQSNYNTISENTLIDNGGCIFEFECIANIIENNNCSGTTKTEPIFIDDTATGIGAHNWTWAESQSWCSGSGTWSDPYILENLNIDGFGLVSCIEIYNSYSYFIIRNCTVYNAVNEGIKLENTKNGTLSNNICFNNIYGLLQRFKS